MFDIADRKRSFQILLNAIRSFPLPDPVLGALTFFFHNYVVGIPVLMVLFGPVNRWYYASFAFIMMLLPLHLYYNGCVFIRLERALLGERNWKGMWTVPFSGAHRAGYTLTKNTESNIYTATAIIIILLGVLRIVWHQL